jgi:hypothetical protein
MDKDCIDRLIALGTDPQSILRIQDLAAREMQRNGHGYTLHNACAATLSWFMNEAGINVPVTLGAGRLARRLGDGRRWTRIECGDQFAGDVGVTFDRTQPPGADHVYLVVERVDADEMIIADNQAPRRHPRRVSGGGKTPTEYFLRAPEEVGLAAHFPSLTEDAYPEGDEDTNELEEPFDDDGSPAR